MCWTGLVFLQPQATPNIEEAIRNPYINPEEESEESEEEDSEEEYEKAGWFEGGDGADGDDGPGGFRLEMFSGAAQKWGPVLRTCIGPAATATRTCPVVSGPGHSWPNPHPPPS